MVDFIFKHLPSAKFEKYTHILEEFSIRNKLAPIRIHFYKNCNYFEIQENTLKICCVFFVRHR